MVSLCIVRGIFIQLRSVNENPMRLLVMINLKSNMFVYEGKIECLESIAAFIKLLFGW